MQFRFVGENAGDWYGVALDHGAVVEIPDHLVAKAQGRPDMFEPVVKPRGRRNADKG